MFKFICLAFAGLIGANASVSDIPRLLGVKLASPPTIDGVIGADEWKDAARATRFIDSLNGQPVKDQTEAWLAYDKDAIYVAFYAHDEEPDGIVGREIKPGSEFDGEDVLALMINPQGTRTWDGRCVFRVNALNTQNESISGGRASKREWRGEWTSAVRRVSDGWCAELRIPWKVLNYPPGQERTMDLNFYRYQARTSIQSSWSDTTVQERAELNGYWVGVSPPVQSAKSLPKFLGYAAPEYDDGNSGLRMGLDVKYAFTPQFSGLVSINPDFKNIESEIAGIDFTRTERYLGEARPFFNEGSDYFDVGSYPFGFAQMFYSRRVANMDWGAKAYGQISPTLGVGALVAVDTGDQTSTVMRINKNLGPKKSFNAWYTGVERPGESSSAAGFTAKVGQGNYNLGFNIANSRQGTGPSATAGDADFTYQVPHWFTYVKYQWIPPDFASPLAYIPWTDRRGGYLYNEYNMQYRSGPLKRSHADFFSSYYEQYDGTEQQKGVEVGASVVTRSDIKLGAGISRNVFYGERDDTQSLRVTFNESNRYKKLGLSYDWGEREGRSTRYTSVNGSYRLFKGLDLGVAWSLFNFTGEERLGIVTLGYEITPLDSISGRFVNRSGSVNAFLAYRHGGGSGIEYYVIVGDPNADKWRSRVSLKVVWAF